MQAEKLLKGIFACVTTALTGVTLLVHTATAQGVPVSHVSVQGSGLFTDGSNAPDRAYDGTTSGGFLIGYGRGLNDWAGFETNYGWSRNTHAYSTLLGGIAIPANIHEVTGAFVGRFNRQGRYQPYVLAGGGILIFDPRVDVTIIGGPDTQAKPAFVYGGGLRINITSRFGVRVEYRGFLLDTPDFGISSLDFDRTTHLAQPSAGIVFRF